MISSYLGRNKEFQILYVYDVEATSADVSKSVLTFVLEHAIKLETIFLNDLKLFLWVELYILLQRILMFNLMLF
jgi:hypothetical protein